MKRRYFLVLCLLLFLFSGTVTAGFEDGQTDSSGIAEENDSAQVSADSEGIRTDSFRMTEENRYDPAYYQKPKARARSLGAGKARSAQANQDLETYIVEQLQQFSAVIDVKGFGIPAGEAKDTFFQIVNSHPELFFVGNYVGWSYDSSGMALSYKNIEYRGTQANVLRQQKELEAAAEQALAWVDDAMSDMEKALAVHDYLVLNCEYDQERLQNGTVPGYSHSAYGALVSKLAVCDGYSHAYSYILKKLDIPCELVTSDSMSHAWSMVSIDGDWYHVDVTWDDPIWDCIGRVGHNYFLLSDQVISDSGHKHSNWNAGHRAVSDTYKQAFWTGIQSAFCYWNGDWYYARYNGSSRTADVLKKQELLGGGEVTVHAESGLWGNYGGNYMYLDLDAQKRGVYFNSGTSIYRLTGNRAAEIIFEPELSVGQYIFGFTIQENQLCYGLQSTPNLSGKQSIRTHPLPELPLAQITGITAENLTAVYDGKAKVIQVKGTKSGDAVSYAGADGVYGSRQPEMKNAGTYQISYKVERNGCEPFLGKAKVVIEKAVPIYQVPKGLKIKKGQPLGEVKLPAGFSWETDTGTKWQEAGEITCYAVYLPEDAGNYKEVSHISVKITVEEEGQPENPPEEESPENPPEGEKPGQPENPPGGENPENPENPPEGERPGQPENPPGEDGTEGNQKEKPSYTVPQGLSGRSGSMLNTVKLPAGFVWQTSGNTRLWREGTYTYYVKYIPGDIQKYVPVSNIPVKVKVTCPGHRYLSKVIRTATRTRNGQEKFTCEICGDMYTREIAAYVPKKPEQVTGLKVTGISASSLKVSWKKTEGVKYRVVLYHKNAVISTVYTANNVHVCKKLKPAADYLLKVTAYREIDGGKYYAEKEASVRASTALGKAKLVSVKSKGTGKAQIAWKRTSGADGYEIYMKTGKSSYKKIKTIAKGKTVAFTKSGLKKGKSYSFRIRAFKKSQGKKVYGSYSNVKTWKQK